MNEIEQKNHVFYKSTHSSLNHIYYLKFREDIYIAVGCDYREETDYGFMQEVRLEPSEVEETTKEKIKLWTDMSPIAFELLLSGIVLHN